MTSRARRSTRPVRITWLGHSAFRFHTPGGKTIYIDPWLDNPSAPPEAASASSADLIFVSHGHADHLGTTVELARRTGAAVYCIYEVALYLQSCGISNVIGMNISGSVTMDGIVATMTAATHSGGIETANGILGGAVPAGFVLSFENGCTVYHAGDTGLFGDMKLIGEMYRPSLAILPIGGLYTMGPREAARACTLLKPRLILGMHYGTFPALTGTPAELKRFLPSGLKRRVRTLEPGGTLDIN